MDTKEQSLYIDSQHEAEAKTDLEACEIETPQVASHDPWYQVGLVLITSLNSAYALGYSGIVMVPLGWVGGTLGLIAAAFLSLYANTLLARVHETGGIRHSRYRDLAGHIYGRKMYYLTWTLQYINLFMVNTGFIILAGQALKAIYTLHNNEAATLKLPYCIAITGIICSIFAFGIPHLSSLRLWLGVSTFLSCIYIIAAIGLSMRDGLNNPARDYEISSSGSSKSRMFGTIGAAANLIFAFNSGMLPEIQATIKHPSVKNMQKALSLQFTAGIVPFYAVTFIGYWAYGSSTSSYLLNNVHGPKWIKILANAAAFFQTVISLHIFGSPMYEFLDTKFGRSNESAYSVGNWIVRVLARGTYLTVTTLLGALLPFVGDFMNITGAVSVLPLTFVLANHMYIKVKGKDLSSLGKTWHWANLWFFAFLSVIATVAAFRFMVIDSRAYHVFADL